MKNWMLQMQCKSGTVEMKTRHYLMFLRLTSSELKKKKDLKNKNHTTLVKWAQITLKKTTARHLLCFLHWILYFLKI